MNVLQNVSKNITNRDFFDLENTYEYLLHTRLFTHAREDEFFKKVIASYFEIKVLYEENGEPFYIPSVRDVADHIDYENIKIIECYYVHQKDTLQVSEMQIMYNNFISPLMPVCVAQAMKEAELVDGATVDICLLSPIEECKLLNPGQIILCPGVL